MERNGGNSELNDKFNTRAEIYAKMNRKGIVSQHIMQKGTNMDDMEKLLTIKDVQEHLQLGEKQGIPAYKN